MNNTIVLVGRLAKKPELRKNDDNKSYAYITLAVKRSYKNADGEYITDFIDCTTHGAVAEATCNNNEKGDYIGIRGQVNSIPYEEDGIKKYKLPIVADKITFLANPKKMEEIKENNSNAVELV